jgi:hippurate hydrolase
MTATDVATDDLLARLEDLYRDLHAHPELSFQEHRTAGIVAAWLHALDDVEVLEGIGGTGVVGVIANGPGPVLALRADMDALPVEEATGLPYASTEIGTDPEGRTVSVAHACGHDVHVTCMLGAVHRLVADRGAWSGTVVAIFQPAEELVAGALAMVDDDLFDRVPRPEVVLGQHVAPLPAGVLGLRSGPAFAASDALRVTLHGRGGHGSRPDTTIDPIVMAASTVMRLQTVVARELAAEDVAVVSVGSLHAGTKSNIIPDDAELQLTVRTYEEPVRAKVLAGIRRIVEGEAATAGAARAPDIEAMEASPAVVNDADGVTRTRRALEAVVGEGLVVDPGRLTGSEDVGVLATAAGVPLVFWLLGGADPAAFASARSASDVRRVVASLPSNHSAEYAPVIDPTIRIGVEALVAAAREWLSTPDDLTH